MAADVWAARRRVDGGAADPGPTRVGSRPRAVRRQRRAVDRRARCSAPPTGSRTRCAAYGLEKGDRVATLIENSAEAVISLFGAVQLGGVGVPINTAYKGEYLRHQLADSGAEVLVVEADARRPGRARSPTRSSTLEHVVVHRRAGEAAGDTTRARPGTRGATCSAADDTAPASTCRPADLATFIYTGGTTGPSKGCMLSHNYHEALARQIGICWERTADDVVWTPLPLFHFNAIVTAVLGPLLFGGRAAIYRRFSVSNFWPEMNRIGATITSTLGTMAYLLAHDVDRPEMPRSGAPEANTTLRLLGAAPLPVEVDDVIRSGSASTTFSGAYGVTEASLISWQPPGVAQQARTRPASSTTSTSTSASSTTTTTSCRAGTEGEIVIRPKRPARDVRGLLGPARGDGRDQPQLVVPHRRHRPDRRRRLPLLRRPQGRLPAPAGREHLELRGRADPDGPRRARRRRRARGAERAHRGRPEGHRDRSPRARPSPRRSSSAGASTSCPYFALPRYIEFRAELPRSPGRPVLKRELRDEGVSRTTWDADTTGINLEKR